MDDELTLTDPDHPNAQEAATATARLLIAVHASRHSANGNEIEHDESPLGPGVVAGHGSTGGDLTSLDQEVSA